MGCIMDRPGEIFRLSPNYYGVSLEAQFAELCRACAYSSCDIYGYSYTVFV